MGVAVAAAVAGVVLMMRYLDERVATVRVPTVPVVVITADMELGTTLTPDLVKEIRWPEASRPEGTFDKAADNDSRNSRYDEAVLHRCGALFSASEPEKALDVLHRRSPIDFAVIVPVPRPAGKRRAEASFCKNLQPAVYLQLSKGKVRGDIHEYDSLQIELLRRRLTARLRLG